MKDTEEPLTISLKVTMPDGSSMRVERRVPEVLIGTTLYDWYNIEIQSAAAQLEGQVRKALRERDKAKARLAAKERRA